MKPHYRLHSYLTTFGEERATCQAVIGDVDVYHLGTFPTLQRAEIAGRIFLYWVKNYPNHDFHKIKRNRTRDAI